MNYLLISIQPKFVKEMVLNEKRVEFRKKLPKKKWNKALIYSSSPVQKIVYSFEKTKETTLPLEELWEKTKKIAGISKEFFDEYFIGKKEGSAIFFDRILELEKPITLEMIGVKRPPQSFMYLGKEIGDIYGV